MNCAVISGMLRFGHKIKEFLSVELKQMEVHDPSTV